MLWPVDLYSESVKLVASGWEEKQIIKKTEQKTRRVCRARELRPRRKHLNEIKFRAYLDKSKMYSFIPERLQLDVDSVGYPVGMKLSESWGESL